MQSICELIDKIEFKYERFYVPIKLLKSNPKIEFKKPKLNGTQNMNSKQNIMPGLKQWQRKSANQINFIWIDKWDWRCL